MKRILLLALSFAAMAGVAFWMRELASWRPKVVGRVNINAQRLYISRDGGSLIVRGNHKEQIVALKSGATRSKWHFVDDFELQHGLETYPRVWVDENQARLYFSPLRGKKIPLEGVQGSNQSNLFPANQGVNASWSKLNREVYGEAEGAIFIWDWNSGKLKKRARYGKFRQRAVRFSPDGKWLLAYERGAGKAHCLWRYDVRTGTKATLIKKGRDFFDFGFSPDGTKIYFVQSDGNLVFQVVRSSDFKPMWGANWAGSAKWLPDGRIGIIQTDGFEWRDASGRVTLRLLGPFNQLKHIKERPADWVPSPDGKWIYSVNLDGAIWRWRAR